MILSTTPLVNWFNYFLDPREAELLIRRLKNLRMSRFLIALKAVVQSIVALLLYGVVDPMILNFIRHRFFHHDIRVGRVIVNLLLVL